MNVASTVLKRQIFMTHKGRQTLEKMSSQKFTMSNKLNAHKIVTIFEDDIIQTNRPNKIKRTQLIQSVENGGIQLTNIDSFLNAIKCCWVKRYLDNANTKNSKKYGDSLLFECNISNTILHEIANENIFLSDVLSAWSDVTHNLETQTSSKTILWNNKDITSNNKTFFYKDWFERSIKYVDQLYDYRIKDFYSFNDICYIYGIPSNNFLKYYTLIKSIPIHIKSEINTNNTPCTQTTFVENILGRKNKTNKIFYTTLQIKNPTENSKTQNKWQVLFGVHELNWKHIFTMPYKATIESTLRNFQYKYIHRIIATNKYLFKCKLSNSNLCDFCSENIETIEHLFWECKHIQPIWNQLTSFLEQQQLNVKLSFLNIEKEIALKKNVRPPGGHAFQPTKTIFIQDIIMMNLLIKKNAPPPDIIGTNLLTKFHDDVRKPRPPPFGGHVFQPTGTNFKLIEDIIGTNHSPMLTRKIAPPTGCHVFKATRTFFKLVQDTFRFRPNWTINVASGEKCPDIIGKKNLLSKVLTRKNSPPQGGHVFQ
ncbi:hypothetical protein DPMN_182034 [Dreissena polymorpha]|uniref:Reverse transcriptase zinc-binding domain-containing protein n=1 Tax=Dreissena polymorpha TaxID=45954 RepID=A0A9D4DER5_DREPO|nr:hypothetical protein DPMN_182034 [Dreissena polymorpha]